jgi:uncharacterized protein (TIGR04222 family)
MTWLMHNPIADMPGPQFLWFYAVAIGVILGYGWWSLRRWDPTASLPAPLIPTNPDPYEIACLRGGDREVSRLMVLALLERQYLETTGDGEIRRRIPRMDPDSLNNAERQLLHWFDVARKPRELFSGQAGEIVRGCTAPLEQRLLAEQLVASPELRSAVWRTVLACATAVAAVGGYKLAVALEKGRSNYRYLILMMIFGVASTLLLSLGRRLTARGRTYLQNLSTAFADLRREPGFPSDPAPKLLLAAGVFGMAVLAGTEYEPLRRLYARSERDSGSSCGGGDSGGGCGGGDGGGGCGGCGGGGE